MGTLRPALLALALISVAQAQAPDLQWQGKTFSVGESRVVADRIDQVTWSPDGLDLAYTRSVDGCEELGVYNLAEAKGAGVASLAKDERIEQMQWLNSGHKLLFVTRRHLENRPVPTDALAVNVADARARKCRELWSGEAAVSDGGNFEVDMSPTLSHAILTLHIGKNTRYLVLTLGADSIVESSDLEEAHRQGEDLAGWSVDGTAIFAPQSDQGFSFTGVVSTSGGSDSSVKGGDLRFQFTSAAEAQDLSNAIKLTLRLATRPDIEVGATTFECVPGNGVLRQIRFPGYYSQPEVADVALGLEFRDSDIKYDLTTANVKSLWLVPNVPAVGDGKTKPVRPQLPGILVSAEAGEAWQSPTGRAIAFTCHHALFVRDVTWER